MRFSYARDATPFHRECATTLERDTNKSRELCNSDSTGCEVGFNLGTLLKRYQFT